MMGKLGRKFGRWPAVIGGAVVLATGLAGAGFIALGAASPAMASTPGTCISGNADTTTGGTGNSACLTTATATVASSVTISDTTPAIDWPSLVPGATNVAANMPVAITVDSNDPAGYTVYVDAYGTQNAGGGMVLPCDLGYAGVQVPTLAADQTIPFGTGGLTVEPNGTDGPGGTSTNGLINCTSSGYSQYTTDSKSGVSGGSGDSYSDNWLISIPGGTLPANYYASLQYTVLGG
jgi:hypothetical protein